MRFFSKVAVLIGVLGLLGAAIFRPVSAETTELTRENLELFLDNLSHEDMKKYNIPGLAIVVVKDDQIFLKKGYGYSNLENQTPINPDTSIFRIGSVSKPITSTAAMQLVENRQLDLNTDVNEYLRDFKIHNKFSTPVTLAHLLTQTGGFDGKAIGLLARPNTEVPNLSGYLSLELPPLVREPGKIMSYANYGIALVGELIEEVTGLSFDEYIQKNIFDPLQMTNSTYKLLEVNQQNFVQGYQFAEGKYSVYENGVVTIPPTGAVHTTATDMANFMIAHLNEGKFNDKQLLNPKTLKLMHEQHFTNDNRIAGSAYGFWERYENGLRLIDFDGAIPGISSAMHLIPDKKVGYFVSYNSNKTELRDNLLTKFLDTFYPDTSAEPTINIDSSKRYKDLEGSYRDLGYSRGTIEKLDTFFRQFKIYDNKNGTITASFPSGESFHLYEVENGLFRDLNEKDRYFVFKKDSSNQMMFYKRSSFEKLKFYEKTGFQIVLVGFFIVFNTIFFIIALFNLIKSKLKRINIARLDFIQFTLLLLSLLFTSGLVLGYKLTPRIEFVCGVPAFFRYLLYLPLFILVFTIVYVVVFVRDLSKLSLSRRFVTVIILAECSGFLLFLNYWNLV